MKIREKRKAGKKLGRDGLAERIILIAREITNGTYKEAMANAGRIAELVDAASYDEYWRQKTELGRQAEICKMLELVNGEASKKEAMSTL